MPIERIPVPYNLSSYLPEFKEGNELNKKRTKYFQSLIYITFDFKTQNCAASTQEQLNFLFLVEKAFRPRARLIITDEKEMAQY